MNNQLQSPKQHFATLLGYTCMAQGKCLESIKSTFSDYEFCIIDYYDKKEYNKIVKIEILDAFLVCSISKNGLCDYCACTFDNLLNIQEYIHYYNEKYLYNYLNQTGVLEKCALKLQVKEKEAIFSFIPYIG